MSSRRRHTKKGSERERERMKTLGDVELCSVLVVLDETNINKFVFELNIMRLSVKLKKR